MTPLGIVVITRDREARLRSLLESLRAQTVAAVDLSVVVVDDGSSDGTPDVIASFATAAYPPLRTVRVEGHPGVAALRNRGWRATDAELVAFIDDDCEADPRWAEALLTAASSHPGAGIQGRTLPIGRELAGEGPLSRTKRIEAAGPWYQTCNIAYPRALLELLDGFDETLAVAGEDTDLAWRAIEVGTAIEYAPDALARHAVEQIGVGGWLRIAERERVLSKLFRRHPALRAEVTTLGVFKDEHKAAFALALAGVALGRRFRPALALAIPYAVLLARRCRATAAGPRWAAWFTAYDAVAFAHSLRGAVESRSWLV